MRFVFTLVLAIFSRSAFTAPALCELLALTPAQRVAALRENPAKWIDDSGLSGPELDLIFELRVNALDAELENNLSDDGRISRAKLAARFGKEEIWYAPGSGQQSPWPDLLRMLTRMNVKPGEVVADLGSGLGRLGLLLGVLRPDARFVGVELVTERARCADAAARALGLSNVRYTAGNLAEIELPHADHFYMFNPTTPATSEIITRKMLERSAIAKFKVHLLSGFASELFWDNFARQADGSFSLIPAPDGRSRP